MKIYGFPTFNVTKVLLTAEELGIAYEYVALDPTKGETQSPEHRQRHPLGKVPVLEHQGKYLFESVAICRYLSRISDSRLYGGDAWHKALIDQWMDYSTLQIGRWLATFFFQEVVMAKFFGEEIDQARLTEAAELLATQMPVIENHLAQNEFFVGDSLSLADLIAFSYLHTHEKTSVSIEPYANIRRWYGAIKSRPSFTAAMSNFPNNDIFG